MTNIKYLYETLEAEKAPIQKYKPEILKIPNYISNNLKYEFFDWQEKAFENFLIYEEDHKTTPTHLMFNMATGTGKTLLMASMILYYYNKGYRHFIFFVNQNNIVDKTENNFCDNTHNKYLYQDKIVIEDKTINIKKVETFSDNPQNIEIKFTTIQKLYNDIHLQKENCTTLDDLNSKDIVMLADEAHHLNANTSANIQQTFEIKDNTNKDIVEKLGWEHTVIELILNKNNVSDDNRNVLLEFTATIPSDEKVAKKYEDKIVYKFGLKEFLSAGYTKEINLISSTLNKKQRVFQTLLFNWYRHKIALKNGIANFKPVILFRSKTIDESQKDYEEFLDWIDSINIDDFDFLKTIADKISQTKSIYEQGKSRTQQVLSFIKNENIKYGEIVNFIKNSFTEKNIIITNSKTNKTKKEKTDEETEKLLNSLEDKNNHIRAIFTVDRLTEGWDVLNLFDIVRLYQGQNAGGSTKKTPEATTKEKQLIGRGVRYFPFAYKDKIKNKRKFDDDLQNELRVLEELFYHTYDEESKYISHLKNELRKDGFIRDDKIIKTFDLKKEFKDSDFYRQTKILCNEPIDNLIRRKKSLEDIDKDFFVPYKITGLELNEQEIDFDTQEDLQKLNLSENSLKTISLKFKDIEKHIFRKAINIKAKQESSLFQFEKLKEVLEITSIDDLQDDKLANFEVKIVINKKQKYDDIYNYDKLNIVLKFLDNIFVQLKQNITPKIGSEFFAKDFKDLFNKPKEKIINENNLDDSVSKDNDWYILDGFVGTSEEKALIGFIKETIGNLEKEYDEIYLLRNEEVFKIFDFKKARGFMPDFLLFLKSKDEINYQIFIEPKQEKYMSSDEEIWKEEFLKEISQKYGFDNIIKAENKEYRLLGLPFFNKNYNSKFKEEYDLLLY